MKKLHYKYTVKGDVIIILRIKLVYTTYFRPLHLML